MEKIARARFRNVSASFVPTGPSYSRQFVKKLRVCSATSWKNLATDGILCAVASSRFTSASQRDRIAGAATELGLPYEEVRARIEATFSRRFHVSLDPGIVLVIAGGVMVALGGGLNVAWAARAPTPGV